MPRRRIVLKREITPDPKFSDRTVARFINRVMKGGKKSVAQQIVYGAFDVIAERVKDDPLKVFKRALENIKPVVETKSRRVGGANYQVPVEVRPNRREALGFRWLILYAGARPGHSMRERLADEIIDAYHVRGASIKKRDDVHKMAEANKAFAHYRW
jgi:small subunit ribosomal protein S7